MRKPVLLSLLLAAGGLVAVAPAVASGPPPAPPASVLVFNGEGNRLNAYDAATGEKQVVIPSASDDPAKGRDINAQICFTRRGTKTFFIAGEDTGQGGDGAPGWGLFQLHGDRIGALGATQVGKLVPKYAPERQSNPENYGCGFLPDGRLVTSDVGDQFFGMEGNGQLIVWFPPFEDGPGSALDTNYCKVDTGLATAGGIWVGEHHVYVASARDVVPGHRAGIYRYPINRLPTDASCGGDRDVAPSSESVGRELFIPADHRIPTPSAIVPSGRGTWYVSSVYNGVIAEYTHSGAHVRNVVEGPLGLPTGQVSDSGTPFGIGTDSAGNLYYADIGVVLDGPADGEGSVQKVAVDGTGKVSAPARLDEGLDFPDGIGVLELPASGHPAPPSSDWPCGNWGMYGASPARTFSTSCPTRLSDVSAPGLVHAWTYKTDRTVTASPAVVDGTLYVGDWSGTMYALRADTGTPRWRHTVDPAPGASFGPIVSSAAVVDAGSRRLVVFGAGPRLYALDATDGSRVWVSDFAPAVDGTRVDDTPVEIQSSPVVWDGVVYVGIDTHNRAGTGVPGGLLAVDVRDGALRWKFEPELGADKGCGGVWSSPALDTASGTVFVATANCGDATAWTRHTEAVTALDARTGAVRWAYQPRSHNSNDWDFGATPNVFTDRTGRRVVGAGSKDGSYYILGAADGRLLARAVLADATPVRENFSIAGVIGSPAVWQAKVFTTTAVGGPPYFHSLDGTTGDIRWRGAAGPSYAASAAVNGVVFAGALDGVLRAFDADRGAVLWASPSLGPISSGPAVVGDTVFVGSGTSSSDACVKGNPTDPVCRAAFGQGLGSAGGVHAFSLPAFPA